MSTNYSTLLNSPETVPPLTQNIPLPSKPGNTEVYSLSLPTAGVNYYIAVHAVDDAGNQGEVSNIVSMSVVNDQSWKRGEYKRMTSSQSISLQGLILSACAAAVFVFIVISCGCYVCSKTFKSGSRKNDFNYHRDELSNKILHGRDFQRGSKLNMYQLPYLYFVKGNRVRDPRIYGYKSDSYLYYIS